MVPPPKKKIVAGYVPATARVKVAGIVGSGGQIPPPGNLPGVKHGILTPRFFGKKYFLVNRSIDSQQNH